MGERRIPLTVDGRPGRLTGELERFARRSLPLWLGLLLCISALAALIQLAHRRDLLPRLATGLAIAAAAASVVVELVLAFDAYASPGTWIEAVDSIVFLAVGLGVLFRGPESLRMGGAVGAGLLGCLHYADGGLASLGHELDVRFAGAVVGSQRYRRGGASGGDATQGAGTALAAQPTDERLRK